MMAKKPRKPRLLSLCTGIGGIDLAAEMAGWEIAGQCELDDYCQRVLARHWPDVRRVSDIRSVWGDSFDGPIDLVAGGIPCQPWSVAGKRRGALDDRHLWPEMRRIVAIYQPAWVLVENVAGFARLALDGVLTDLGADGYEVGAVMVPAAATGAPHLRERVFVVAHAQRGIGRRVARCLDDTTPGCQHEQHAVSSGGSGTVADAAGGARCGATQRDGGFTLAGDASATGDGLAVTCGARLEGCGPGRSVRQPGAAESRMGRDADGLSRRLDGAGLAVDLCPPRHAWPAGPGHAQHEWESPRTTHERIPDRAARLKALGNAVVPQQCYPILAAIIAVWRQEQAEQEVSA